MSEVIIAPEDVVLDVSYLYYLNTASPHLVIPLLFLSSSPPVLPPTSYLKGIMPGYWMTMLAP